MAVQIRLGPFIPARLYARFNPHLLAIGRVTPALHRCLGDPCGGMCLCGTCGPRVATHHRYTRGGVHESARTWGQTIPDRAAY